MYTAHVPFFLSLISYKYSIYLFLVYKAYARTIPIANIYKCPSANVTIGFGN